MDNGLNLSKFNNQMLKIKKKTPKIKKQKSGKKRIR